MQEVRPKIGGGGEGGRNSEQGITMKQYGTCDMCNKYFAGHLPGQPPPSDVCHARGAQGLDPVGGVYRLVKVPWQVCGLHAHWLHAHRVPPLGPPLHVQPAAHHRAQHHCRQALGRPGQCMWVHACTCTCVYMYSYVGQGIL